MVPKKYRIAIVEDNPVTYRLPIYRELFKSKKIDFKVYFSEPFRGSNNFNSKNNEFFKKKKFNHVFLKNYYPFKFSFIPKDLWKLWNFEIIPILFKNKYDAVIIYGYSSTFKKLSYIGAKFGRTPIIFREEINEMSPKKIKNFFKHNFYKFLFKIPSAFLYSYTKNKEFYLKYGVKNSKLFFHPCSVDNEFYNKLSKKLNYKKIRKSLNIPSKSIVLLCVGTLDERKGSFNTLKAFKNLKNENVYLIFVGDGPDKINLQKYQKTLNLKNVRFINFLPDPKKLSEYYVAADIFIMASISDPSPKVLNEAMNFSLPIISSTGVGTARDLVKNNINGIIFSKGVISELQRAMEKLISNKELRTVMGRESLKIVSKWNVEEDVEAILNSLNYVSKNEK